MGWVFGMGGDWCKKTRTSAPFVHSQTWSVPSHPLPLQVLKNICWFLVLSPAYSTEEGSSSDHATLLAATQQVGVAWVGGRVWVF